MKKIINKAYKDLYEHAQIENKSLRNENTRIKKAYIELERKYHKLQEEIDLLLPFNREMEKK